MRKTIKYLTKIMNGPEMVPNIVSNVVAGVLLASPSVAILGKYNLSVIVLVVLAIVLLGRRIATTETWRGKTWFCQNDGEITFEGTTNLPDRIDIKGLQEGPLKVIVTKEVANCVEGELICVDHGKVVAACVITFLPRNQIHLVANGGYDYHLDLFFGLEQPTEESP